MGSLRTENQQYGDSRSQEVNEITQEARTDIERGTSSNAPPHTHTKDCSGIWRSSTQRRGGIGNKRNRQIKWEVYQEKENCQRR